MAAARLLPRSFLRFIIALLICLGLSVLAHVSLAEDASLPTVQNPQPATESAARAPSNGSIVDDVINRLENKDDGSSPAAPEAETPSPAQQTNINPAPTPTTIPGIVAQGDNTTLPAVPEPPPTFEDKKTVILHVLDKVTARTQTLEVPVGQQFNFGALTIAVRACRARPPLEPADAAAFLQIVEQKPGEPMIARFSGWMFASAPSLSALEHPVYDVWVVGCGGDKIDKKG